MAQDWRHKACISAKPNKKLPPFAKGLQCLLLVLVAISIAQSGFCQIIPSSHRATWEGNGGIGGGIPTRTSFYRTFIGHEGATTPGALRILPSNTRYLSVDGVNAKYLTGVHTWNDVQIINGHDEAASFLTFAESYGFNFMRLWTFEHSKGTISGFPQTISPLPWKRTGPGNAADGGLKFNLDQFDQTYFDRLRATCIAAQQQGIYVSVMLFQGFSTDNSGGTVGANPWVYHPFNSPNNINSVNGTNTGGYSNGTGTGIHSTTTGLIAIKMAAYTQKVVDTVYDLDNIVYEVINETQGPIAWQKFIRDTIRARETQKLVSPLHMVGFTIGGYQCPTCNNNNHLLNSEADFIAPSHATSGQNYGNCTPPDNSCPPVAAGTKVIFDDTDHIFGVGGDRIWVWKAFTRGMNVLYMDKYLGHGGFTGAGSSDDNSRRAMAATKAYADRMNFAALTPSGTSSPLCSTTYCLANSGQEYLAYNPAAGQITINNLPSGTYYYEWFDTVNGTKSPVYQQTVSTGNFQPANGPTGTGGNVLYVRNAGAGPLPSPTATPTAAPSPTPTPLGTSFPSTAGVITNPFVITANTISQAVQTVDPTQGGRALYTFSVPASGDYLLSIMVNCPDGGSNSIFVNIDAEPSSAMAWDIPVTSGPQIRVASWSPSATPKAWTLSAGPHQLNIRGREANTILGQIILGIAPVAPHGLHIQ